MREHKTAILSIVTVMVVIIGLFVGIYWSSQSFGGDPHEIMLPGEVETVSTETAQYASLNEELEKIEINADNVQKIIASMARPENYSCKTEIKLFYSGGEMLMKNEHFVMEGYQKTEQQNELGVVEKHIISGKGTVFIWKPGEKQYYRSNIGEITADDMRVVPTYEDIADYPKSSIVDAGYAVLNGQNCIMVEAVDQDTGYEETYYISLDSGLLVEADKKHQGEEVYSMKMSDLVLGGVSESVFLLPNNVLAMDVE